MTYAVGQTVVDVITLRDDSNVAITGLLEDDFAVLEAYLATASEEVDLVGLEEIDDGQYTVSFEPSTHGPWALHYVYEGHGVFRENTKVYAIAPTSEIVVVTAGGTWTYSGDLTDPIQEVRFLIQDTDGDYPLFTDTEVSYALGAANGATRRASIVLVERLLARFAGMADTTELDLSIRASQLYDHYKDLLATLRNSFGGSGSIVPYAGGISISDIRGNLSNLDRNTGVFDKRWPYRFHEYGRVR